MSDARKINWQAVYDRLRESEQKLTEVLSPNPERIHRIQAERAARLASRRQAGEVEATVPVMLVEIGGERTAIRITAIAEVMPIPTLTRVAGAPDDVRGVVNLRGELYSVIDPSSFMQAGRGAGEISWGVALRHPTLRIVLGAQAVLRIENIPASILSTVEDGVLRIGNEIAILLDTRTILERLEREASNERVREGGE
jgi:chemotaxis signal transduction protein